MVFDYCPGRRRLTHHRCVTPVYHIPVWIFDCVLDLHHKFIFKNYGFYTPYNFTKIKTRFITFDNHPEINFRMVRFFNKSILFKYRVRTFNLSIKYYQQLGPRMGEQLFRIKVIGGLILFFAILLVLPYFFSFIEARHGTVLNDWLLRFIPARDFSVTILIFVWSTSLLIIVRCFQHPAIF